MEEGGLHVLDVHKRKRLLAVYAGELLTPILYLLGSF